MTENEAIEELKYDCNEIGKAIPCDTSWGESFENAYAMAINALEEVQQYRTIGTPEECRAAVEKQNRLQKTEHWKILTGTIVTVMLTIRLCIAAMRRNQKMRRVLPILFNTEMVRAKEGVCVEIS